MKIEPVTPLEALVLDPFAGRNSAAENRRKILNLQEAMVKARADGALVDCDFPLEHTFTEGVYARQMTIPQGSVIVGKIHRHAHLNFVMRGHVSVMTDAGVTTLKGPTMFVSTPGTKRVVHAHEDTVWITVHVTDKTDLDKIEDSIIAKSFEALGLPVSIQKGEIT